MAVTTTYSLTTITSPTSVSLTAGTQRGSALVSTGGGNSAVFYFDAAAGEIAARTISATNVVGARVIASSGSIFTGTAGDGSAEPVSAVTLSNGNIVLTWASNEPTKSIYFRIFDANLNPLTPATLAESSALNSTRPDVAALAGGGFVIVWEKEFSATDHDATYRRFSAEGTALDDGLGVSVDGSGALDESPSVAGLADGGFAVAFTRRDTVTGDTEIWGGVRNADGSQRAAAVLQDGGGTINRDVEVVARSDGGFSLIYEDSFWTGSATNTEITVKNLDSAGVFQNYVQATQDASDRNEGSVAGASSPEGFVAFAYNYPFSATDMDIKSAVLSADGSILTNPASAVSLAGGGLNESVVSLVWLDGGTVRYAYDYAGASGSDPDAGIRSGVAALRRTSTGDTGNNVIDWSGSLARNVMDGGDGDDTLTGGASIDVLNGGNNNDTLIGNAGNDILNGGAGQNTLRGGTGDDTYYVSQQSDLIFENVGEGTDWVFPVTNFYLYANVENLQMDGSGNYFAVGNALNNEIIGNNGDNLLIGGAGKDTLSGDSGVDSLFGQDGIDVLNGDAGIDYLVGGNHADSLYGGADPDSLYGEEGDDFLDGGDSFDTDILVGGNGADTLDGASGQGNPEYDLLDGGSGDDIYYVDTVADLTFEAAGAGTGIDTVYANVPVASSGVYLYANVENLVLQGITFFGVGNDLANVMTGTADANWLLGGAGADRLIGAGGNDVLFGQTGADTFVFGAGSGQDTIADFAIAGDKIEFNGIYSSFAQVQAGFVQSGANGAINLGNGNFVVLQGVTMASLTAANFVFAPAAEPPPKAPAALSLGDVAGFHLQPEAGTDFAVELARHNELWLA